MRRSWCSNFVSLAGLALAATLAVFLMPAVSAQSPAAPAAGAGQAAPGESLLAQAARAESDLRIDIAIDRLYALLTEQPGTPDALTARLRLARLLALTGEVQPALLECQMARDEAASDSPARQQAIEMATVLARRLRAAVAQSPAYFPIFEPLPARGMSSLDEPRTMIFEREGRFLLLDEGAERVYRVETDNAASISAPQEPTAVTVLPDGTVLAFGKTGLATLPPTRTVQLGGTWGGRAHQLRKVRSMAALSNGDLLVIDKDYDGLVRCQYPAGTCTGVGPIGKFRVVKVGAADWSYVLDDRGQALRVFDASQRLIGAFGPTLGTTKLERVEDIAVDPIYGLYVLDRDLKRMTVVNMRATLDGKVSAVVTGSFLVPQDGERALKNPWAIGAGPSGSLILAGKGAPRIMRLR